MASPVKLEWPKSVWGLPGETPKQLDFRIHGITDTRKCEFTKLRKFAFSHARICDSSHCVSSLSTRSLVSSPESATIRACLTRFRVSLRMVIEVWQYSSLLFFPVAGRPLPALATSGAG